jgi:hypothetical protein
MRNLLRSFLESIARLAAILEYVTHASRAVQQLRPKFGFVAQSYQNRKSVSPCRIGSNISTTPRAWRRGG